MTRRWVGRLAVVALVGVLVALGALLLGSPLFCGSALAVSATALVALLVVDFELDTRPTP